MKNGLENYHKVRQNKKLRYGYTTGTCAAAAAKAATKMLLTGRKVEQVELLTPRGILLLLEVLDIEIRAEQVSCAIRKDAGDDPDVTDKALIYARVSYSQQGGITIDGGEGVGRVTKPGLSISPGEAAINPVPREMIRLAAETVAQEENYDGGLAVEISVPQGAELAGRTFNPRLGIKGGISILGTSGIVEPMSEKALIQTIEVEMNMHLREGSYYLLVTPGNYGADYLREQMTLPWENHIKCSNYIGETIDMAVEKDAKGILFIAHIGKFVKVAAGIMNTHSHRADGRMEILAAAGIRAGGSADMAREILNCSITDEGLQVLAGAGLLEEAMKIVLERIEYYLDFHTYGAIPVGAVIFSNEFGYLGQTARAQGLIEAICEQENNR